jgi:hypothetical protein
MSIANAVSGPGLPEGGATRSAGNNQFGNTGFEEKPAAKGPFEGEGALGGMGPISPDKGLQSIAGGAADKPTMDSGHMLASAGMGNQQRETMSDAGNGLQGMRVISGPAPAITPDDDAAALAEIKDRSPFAQQAADPAAPAAPAEAVVGAGPTPPPDKGLNLGFRDYLSGASALGTIGSMIAEAAKKKPPRTGGQTRSSRGYANPFNNKF